MSIRKHIPNALSLVRGMIIAPLLLYEAAWRQSWGAALALLLAGTLTDAFDGYLAIRLNAKSKIGQNFLDPLSDGALMGAALLGLLVAGSVHWGIAIVITAISTFVWSAYIVARLNFLKRMARLCEGLLVVYGVGIYLWLALNYAILAQVLWIILPPATALSLLLIGIKQSRIREVIDNLRAAFMADGH